MEVGVTMYVLSISSLSEVQMVYLHLYIYIYLSVGLDDGVLCAPFARPRSGAPRARQGPERGRWRAGRPGHHEFDLVFMTLT